ncbi:MAG: glutamate-cysteine ligase family protein [Nanoarchaeota archaeon]
MKPLKRSLTGFEIETFIIDNDGKPLNAADTILKKTEGLSIIKKECAKSLIEVASLPSETIPDSMTHLLNGLGIITEIAEKHDFRLLPLGCYPGKIEPEMRQEPRYHVQEAIFGERFKIAGRVAGLHCHYTLPRGIFDSQKRIIKILVSSKIKDAFVNSYNMLIAADPALTCFMQSSPYYQCQPIAKDSRIVMYRGGKALRTKDGLYSDHEDFGGLPHYRLTSLDIVEMIKNRFIDWESIIKTVGINIRTVSMYGSILDTHWGPVKINSHGTLEQRGMDMNHPHLIAASGAIIRFVLKKLQEEYYSLTPSDVGVRQPFKIEGDRIHIPPFSYVNNTLQAESAYKGLENPEVFRYCSRFLKFAKAAMPPDRRRMVRPFDDMLEYKETTSDLIRKEARKKGYSTHESISQETAMEIAVDQSQKLSNEVIKVKEMIAEYSY